MIYFCRQILFSKNQSLFEQETIMSLSRYYPVKKSNDLGKLNLMRKRCVLFNKPSLITFCDLQFIKWLCYEFMSL